MSEPERARMDEPHARQKTGMHQTTLRFGPELWRELEAAAVRAGTSIAQYVREAAVQRLARAAARDDAEARAAAEVPSAGEVPTVVSDAERAVKIEGARLRSESERESTSALWGQRRAREHTRDLPG